MKATLMLDEMSLGIMHDLPRRMCASKILRVLLVAVTTDNKQWRNYLKSNSEAREVQLYLREKLLGKFD